MSAELGKILSLKEVVDVGEVSKLRDEVFVLKSSKLELEKAADKLTEDNNASADRIFSLLTEKSELISECDALGVSVKDLKTENGGLEAALGALKDELAAKEESWIAEKADLVAKLDSFGAQLASCQAESLKSFEDGYGECFNRFAGAGFDVKEHGFNSYLADLQGKVEAGKTGSSNHPEGAYCFIFMKR